MEWIWDGLVEISQRRLIRIILLVYFLLIIPFIQSVWKISETGYSNSPTYQKILTNKKQNIKTSYLEEKRRNLNFSLFSDAFLFLNEQCFNYMDPEYYYNPKGEDLLEEFKMDDIELLAQLIQAEAGNQDLTGKRLVADCVLNRIDQARFVDQNDVWSVIYADGQFSVMWSGSFEKAGWNIDEDSFKAAEMEWQRESRLDPNVVFFNGVYENGKRPFKHGGHWFSY